MPQPLLKTYHKAHPKTDCLPTFLLRGCLTVFQNFLSVCSSALSPVTFLTDSWFMNELLQEQEAWSPPFTSPNFTMQPQCVIFHSASSLWCCRVWPFHRSQASPSCLFLGRGHTAVPELHPFSRLCHRDRGLTSVGLLILKCAHECNFSCLGFLILFLLWCPPECRT